MRIKHSMKSVISGLLAAVTMLGSFPSVSVFAAQSNAYVDPADVWLATNNRTSELDANATVTYGTDNCTVCGHVTPQTCYRVPEYTRSGETALNRGVLYSDGTCMDGESKANLDDGTPGIDAFYTGYHWTKSVCEVCGTLNVVDGEGSYSFGKDVYSLNACDYNFFLDFDNTTHTPYDSENHTTTLKKGKYCQFCKGTYARAEDKQEPHEITEIVDAQLGNQRFHITGECEDCGFIENEYAVAKSVVQSYYGIADGAAHTITLSDLSESGVNTSIRYGESANKCNLTSAPNYTEAGYYPVYYEITYRYAGESMKENGVSYVWLLADNSSSKVQSDTTTPHVHDYRFLETVRPTCTELGYDRFQCTGCGALQKTNYVPASGHDYKTVVIREASCQQGGLELHSCSKCGAFYTEETSMTDHKYQTTNVAATCTTNGYTEHKCIDCGYKYITDLTPLAKHDYREKVTDPTCTGRGFTTYVCADCGDTYVSDYKDPTGHEWDNGHEITHATCNGEGLIEYNCKHCDATKREAKSATGHTPGAAATCTEPQTCTVCGAILELPTGHHYSEAVTVPTCTTMGYTTYTCDDCGKSYVGNYTDKTEHHYDSVITPATCTAMGYTTYTCTECGDEYTSDYIDKKPHNYQAVVTPATCTTMGYTTYTCADCEDSYVADYTDVLPHNYTKQVIPPTCTSQGYTIYTCPDCGKEYIADEKESIPHTFTSVVTEPTCLDMGYTTYTCEDCDYSYVADYTNPLGHDYVETVTEPTCTDIGYSTFNCSRCDASYVGNEKAKLPHNYDKTVTEPTCTEMGYTVFNCRDCGDTYTGAYTDAKGHSYKETVTPPTCTSLGYSTFTCEVCGASYKGNETAKAEHQYKSVVTNPTCTELGYTTITCSVCGETHKINYVEAAGHKPSDWIIDTPATIEHSGSKHKECTVCGATLETAEIPQLSDKDNSDEDGHSKVGDYSILITDKNNNPIFNSKISIDKDDNITIKLPDGRLLSADDITTITVTNSETQQPVEGISIFIADTSNNAATGKTDASGQLKVPNANSSTGDSNGTVADKDNTYVVVVTDKNGELIPNCGVTVGDNYSINVKLPAGTPFDKDNRVTVTVVTETGEPVNGLRVQLIGDADFIENGYTNIKGQITLPTSNTDITDDNGNGEVGDKDGEKVYDYIVTVSDENGLIKDALITLIAKDNSVLVCLPEGKVIDYYNRTTVKVMRSDGTPVKDWKVSVYNKDGSGLRTELTDEDGIVVVPPLSEAPLAKPTPTPDPDAEATPLPGVETTPKPDVTEKPSETAKPTEKPSEPTQKPTPSEKPSETAKPTEKPTETPKPTDTPKPGETAKPTDPTQTPTPSEKPSETSKPTEKPSEPTPTPDMGDGAVVQNKNYKYRVFVWDNDGAITEFGLVKLQDDGNLTIELPQNKVLTADNKVNIRVINENDGSPVKGITVTVTDINGGTASDITNSNGIAIVPVSDTDFTDANGNAQVKDENGNMYNVNVATELEGNIEGAEVKIADGKITVTLPDGTVIDYTDRTTVTVTDKDNAPVKDMSVNVKDSNGGDRTETTDANGKVVVPPLSEDMTDKDGNAQVKDENGNMYNVNVATETKGNVEDAKVQIADGKIAVMLPDGTVIDYADRTTVTVTDKDNAPVKDMSVNVKDNKGGDRTGTTDADGKVVVPPLSEDMTDKDGNAVVDGYTIVVEDTKAKIENAFVEIKDGKISVKLPDTNTLTTSNQTTVTVTDKDAKPVNGMSVTITDKNNATAADVTNTSGKVTLPKKSSSGGGGGGSSSGSGGSHGGGGGGSVTVTTTYNVKVTDKNGKTVNVTKSVKDGKITLTLPNGKTLDGDDYYTIVVTDKNGKAAPNIDVTLKDKKNNSANGVTDTNGKLVLPATEHKSYIVGYEDGTFKPEGNMTRAEAAAIFARNIADRKGEKMTGTKSKFTDIAANLWYSEYIAYLETYNIIVGYDDGTFRPDEQITRAEFVTMCMRFYGMFDKVKSSSRNIFTDVPKSHWASENIYNAIAMDWIKGYADGTFKPDNNITRAEVVTIVNRVTEREADTEYVNKNLSTLNRFTDLTDKGYWAYYEITEAANTHMAVTKTNGEMWVK